MPRPLSSSSKKSRLVKPQGRLLDLAEINKSPSLLLRDVQKFLIDRIDQPSDRRQDILRLFEKVTVTESGCWEWTETSRDDNGYGLFFLEGRSQRATRVIAQWLLGRTLLPSEEVCHTCDNPPCCNPFDLFVDSHKGNMADMAAKGRGHTSPGREGEGNPFSKLLSAQVDEIRMRYHGNEEILQRELAVEYGTTQGVISRIVNNKSWRENVYADAR